MVSTNNAIIFNNMYIYICICVCVPEFVVAILVTRKLEQPNLFIQMTCNNTCVVSHFWSGQNNHPAASSYFGAHQILKSDQIWGFLTVFVHLILPWSLVDFELFLTSGRISSLKPRKSSRLANHIIIYILSICDAHIHRDCLSLFTSAFTVQSLMRSNSSSEKRSLDSVDKGYKKPLGLMLLLLFV